MSGAVVFAGTRVPVQTLMDYLEEGGRLDEFLEDFPTVSREHPGRVRFADDLLRNLARADVASHFSHAFARPLVETDVPVRSTIATRITNDA
jgi:hypothetical protein